MRPTIFLSYCHKNKEQADIIDSYLKGHFDVTVKRDIRDIKAFGNIENLMKSVGNSDYVLMLVSKEYLESESCMYEVIEFIKDTNEMIHFADRTIPIILPNVSSNGSNIYTASGKLFWVKYWAAKYRELDQILKEFGDEDYHQIDKEKATEELRKERDRYKTIAENMANEFLTLITKNLLCVNYEKLDKKGYKQIEDKIFSVTENEPEERISKLDELDQERFKYISIIEPIDPRKPSFPMHDPKFPASETYKINLDGFTDVWIKDESTNPTGTHKDRMALEVLRKFYLPLLRSNIASNNKEVPHLSIISSGNAAVAIQHLLNDQRMPNLHVLTDEKTDERIVRSMEKNGCKVFRHKLEENPLKCKEILELTDNRMGVDISSREMLDPINHIYYDWLSYEIINSRADYCFIPFGTGDLFHNVLNIHSKEFFAESHDLRLEAPEKKVKKTHYIGVTTYNSQSKCDKLFSPYLPFSPIKRNMIKAHTQNGICGNLTELKTIDEGYVDKAMEIANKLNIDCEPSGIAGLGMLLQMADEIDKDAKILIVNTGKLKNKFI
jgi:hypothetical protein